MIMTTCFFVSDLHGKTDRYNKLFDAIANDPPKVVFLGGDLLPHELISQTSDDKAHQDFINDFLVPGFWKLHETLQDAYPRVFLILGNDDPRFEESAIQDAAKKGVWEYIHKRKSRIDDFSIFGYAYIPPTPFQLKDWERYDVSRYVDPGCISPEEGRRSVPISVTTEKYATIQKDLEGLVGEDDLSRSIFLFHTPPYKTNLDRAALDGQVIDHAPLDVHVGSIAVKRFIETRQPLVTLHGHIHESARLTGAWREKIGQTHAFSAAHDGPELALVRFKLEDLTTAIRELL